MAGREQPGTACMLLRKNSRRQVEEYSRRKEHRNVTTSKCHACSVGRERREENALGGGHEERQFGSSPPPSTCSSRWQAPWNVQCVQCGKSFYASFTECSPLKGQASGGMICWPPETLGRVWGGQKPLLHAIIKSPWNAWRWGFSFAKNAEGHIEATQYTCYMRTQGCKKNRQAGMSLPKVQPKCLPGKHKMSHINGLDRDRGGGIHTQVNTRHKIKGCVHVMCKTAKNMSAQRK